MAVEAQTATLTFIDTETLDGVIIEDASATLSYDATIEPKDVSNSYEIILDNEDDFWGKLDCTLSSQILACTEEEGDQKINFSRYAVVLRRVFQINNVCMVLVTS